jgi:hypothetical protein
MGARGLAGFQSIQCLCYYSGSLRPVGRGQHFLIASPALLFIWRLIRLGVWLAAPLSSTFNAVPSFGGPLLALENPLINGNACTANISRVSLYVNQLTNLR